MTVSDFSNRELREAAGLVNAALVEAAEACVVPHTFSDAHKQQLRPLFKAARQHEKQKTVRRGLIAALLALVLGAVAFLAFNDTARASVQKWLRSLSGTAITYQTEGDAESTTKAVSNCIPLWLPEGYTLESGFTDSGFFHASYSKDGAASTIDIDAISGEGASSVSFNLYDADYKIRQITIGDCHGELFLSNDANITSAIVWFDDSTGTSFSVMGCLGEEELLRIAKDLEIQYE